MASVSITANRLEPTATETESNVSFALPSSTAGAPAKLGGVVNSLKPASLRSCKTMPLVIRQMIRRNDRYTTTSRFQRTSSISRLCDNFAQVSLSLFRFNFLILHQQISSCIFSVSFVLHDTKCYCSNISFIVRLLYD